MWMVEIYDLKNRFVCRRVIVDEHAGIKAQEVRRKAKQYGCIARIWEM